MTGDRIVSTALASVPDPASASRRYVKDTLVRGKPAAIECLDIAGQTFVVGRGPLTVVSLEDEWFEDIADPRAVVDALASSDVAPDLFTFWQRLPDVEPRYDYAVEWEHLAALPVSTYDHWWKHQIRSKMRNHIRKCEKEGLTIREVAFDHDFVRGMTAIFNESPVRQQRPFWHYGKDFETVKAQFSRFLFREQMVGAYLDGTMVGFMMLADAGPYALTNQIIASLQCRDRSPTSSLIARGVRLCESQGFGHLVYSLWAEGSLGDFKRRCGFEKVAVPRYYVPLSIKGRLALRSGLHRGWRAMLPKPLVGALKRIRGAWYERREGPVRAPGDNA